MEGTHPLIDALIHLVIYVTVCNASNVCWLLMTAEPLKVSVPEIQQTQSVRQTTNAQHMLNIKRLRVLFYCMTKIMSTLQNIIVK